MREVRLPEISENVQEGTVITIHVGEGDSIEPDQNILEIETDKAAVDIPSPVGGTIAEILVAEGDSVSVGDVVMKVEESDSQAENGQAEGEAESETGSDNKPTSETTEASADEEAKNDREAKEDAEKEPSEDAEAEPEKDAEAGPRSAEDGEEIPASPGTRRFARELGIDLHNVTGSGPGGRISKDDVKSASRSRGSETSRGSGNGSADEERREKMTQVRRLTARNTTQSWAAPHVTHFDEIGLSSVNEVINSRADAAEQAGGKLTVTAVLLVLCARALERFPRFNTSVDIERQELIYHERINIGLAVDTDRGLLVPVVRDANRKDVVDVAVEISGLAEKARSGKIGPDELEGGTFSISNLGGIGGTAFTPVIQSPQVAILGISRSTTKPVYDGEEFQPQPVLPVGLSYDHRANDGGDAARFVKWLKTAAEDPLTALLEGDA